MAPKPIDPALLWLAIVGAALGGLTFALLGASSGWPVWNVCLVLLAVAGVGLGLTRIVRQRRASRQTGGGDGAGARVDPGRQP